MSEFQSLMEAKRCHQTHLLVSRFHLGRQPIFIHVCQFLLKTPAPPAFSLKFSFFWHLDRFVAWATPNPKGFGMFFLRGNVTFQYISFNLTFSHNWVIEYLECSQEIPGPGTEDAQTFSPSKIRICFTVPVC